MKDLGKILEDYLKENNPNCKIGIQIENYSDKIDVSLLHVKIKYYTSVGKWEEEEVIISLWDLIGFIYNKI